MLSSSGGGGTKPRNGIVVSKGWSSSTSSGNGATRSFETPPQDVESGLSMSSASSRGSPDEFQGFAGWSLMAVQKRVPGAIEPAPQYDQPPEPSWNSAIRYPAPTICAQISSPRAWDVSCAPWIGPVTARLPLTQPL